MEYMVLSFDEHGDQAECLDGGTLQQCQETFDASIDDLEPEQTYYLVKVLKSAELKVNVAEFPDGDTETQSEDAAGEPDIIAEHSRICAAPGSGC
jgi:hypothetical protein